MPQNSQLVTDDDYLFGGDALTDLALFGGTQGFAEPAAAPATRGA